MRKLFWYLGATLAGLGVAGCVVVAYLLQASLPAMTGTVKMAGIAGPAWVEFDDFGIPAIHAQSREDAYRLLGYATARDRLFQMDLIRRKMAGRLAEIFGAELLDTDRWHRSMGFSGVASAILANLPQDQRNVLAAYSGGVNQAMAELPVLPFEFLLLGYVPEPWRVEDSLLSILGMHATLAWRGDTERASTVMQAALPGQTLDFFLPQTDAYTEALLSNKASAPALPVGELTRLLRDRRPALADAAVVHDSAPKRGSNAWVVAPSKTAGKRALLANDMHLELAVPNIWYRAELHYGDSHLAGLTLPGVPLVISGSNRHLAWGFTASGADVCDLILLDSDPQNPLEYRTAEGNRRYGERRETLRVKGGSQESLTVRTTDWGPVLPEPLLGKPVAVRWTALDPQATNLNHLNLDRTTTVKDALPLLNRTGGPPLHAFASDSQGNIGWTMTGKIPLRSGKAGLYAYASAGGEPMWRDYIPPDALPRAVNPPSDFLASANQRMVDADYPYAVGQYDWRGYRAYRITERLRESRDLTEGDMLALQLDTRTDFYRYYQNLALSVLETETGFPRSEAAALRRHLRAWDGRAELGSLGLGILVEFRKELLEKVLTPYFSKCWELDDGFEYEWAYADVPLQQLLDAGLPELLPDRDQYPDRDAWVRALLWRSVANLKQRYGEESLDRLAWQRFGEAHIVHPLADAIPGLGRWLNMPDDAQPGCNDCVRNFVRDGGPSERLVVAPGHDEDGILHMPSGQSGHPFSSHYRDQHQSWARGTPTPLWADSVRSRMDFESKGDAR